jgi:predicted benzoate:H+ symporter BenE
MLFTKVVDMNCLMPSIPWGALIILRLSLVLLHPQLSPGIAFVELRDACAELSPLIMLSGFHGINFCFIGVACMELGLLSSRSIRALFASAQNQGLDWLARIVLKPGHRVSNAYASQYLEVAA